MQINGNLLLAAQQALKAAAPAQPAPGFNAALSKAASFTPRDLTQPDPQAMPDAAKPAQPAGPMRLGQHVDLKV